VLELYLLCELKDEPWDGVTKPCDSTCDDWEEGTAKGCDEDDKDRSDLRGRASALIK